MICVNCSAELAGVEEITNCVSCGLRQCEYCIVGEFLEDGGHLCSSCSNEGGKNETTK